MSQSLRIREPMVAKPSAATAGRCARGAAGSVSAGHNGGMDRAPAAPSGVPPDLEGHPDRLKWNARYRHLFAARFTPHPLAAAALALPLPGGPVLDLASGPSGSALAAAAAGREVTAVDA